MRAHFTLYGGDVILRVESVGNSMPVGYRQTVCAIGSFTRTANLTGGFDLMCKQHRTTSFGLFLNGTKDVDVDSMCKPSLKVCSHLTFAFASMSPSKFNIASMETQTQTQMHRMGLNPFMTFYITLNVDANANIKCEQPLKAHSH